MKRVLATFLLLGLIAAAGGAAPLAQNEAYVLLQGSPMYSEKGGKLTWLEGLTIGDKVTITGRVTKFKDGTQEREYQKVKAPDGQEGWTRPAFLAPKSSLAVVRVDQAIVYSEPREVKVTSKSISMLTIVAVVDGGTGGFAKVMCYDRVQKRLFSDATFVSADDLTTSEVDINAAILYTAAVSTDPKDKGVKKNLLASAIKRYGGSIFLPQIQAESGDAPAVAKDVVAVSGDYIVNDNDVNVRSAPDEKNSQVIGKLKKGDNVSVKEKTSQTYTVGSDTAAWYHVTSPDGWVFGSFIDLVNNQGE